MALEIGVGDHVAVCRSQVEGTADCDALRFGPEVSVNNTFNINCAATAKTTAPTIKIAKEGENGAALLQAFAR